MNLKIINTGSAGNCYILTDSNNKSLIIECGVKIEEIKKALEERGECGVGLMKDATDTLNRLKDLGVNARVEPTYRTMPPMIKKNELGEPVDLMLNEKVQVGVVFYLC